MNLQCTTLPSFSFSLWKILIMTFLVLQPSKLSKRSDPPLQTASPPSRFHPHENTACCKDRGRSLTRREMWNKFTWPRRRWKDSSPRGKFLRKNPKPFRFKRKKKKQLLLPVAATFLSNFFTTKKQSSINKKTLHLYPSFIIASKGGTFGGYRFLVLKTPYATSPPPQVRRVDGAIDRVPAHRNPLFSGLHRLQGSTQNTQTWPKNPHQKETHHHEIPKDKGSFGS